MVQTFKSMQKTEEEKRKFLASIQGIELNVSSNKNEEGSSFEDIQRRALGINTSADDVVSLQGSFAAQAGFGIGAGLGYSIE